MLPSRNDFALWWERKSKEKPPNKQVSQRASRDVPEPKTFHWRNDKRVFCCNPLRYRATLQLPVSLFAWTNLRIFLWLKYFLFYHYYFTFQPPRPEKWPPKLSTSLNTLFVHSSIICVCIFHRLSHVVITAADAIIWYLLSPCNQAFKLRLCDVTAIQPVILLCITAGFCHNIFMKIFLSLHTCRG